MHVERYIVDQTMTTIHASLCVIHAVIPYFIAIGTKCEVEEE